MKEQIGFLGLGIMGLAMARNIARAGYPLTVYNRTPKTDPELSRSGVKVAPHPRELAAAADIVIAMLTGPEAIDQLLWGPQGAAPALKAGQVLINMSTVSPQYTQQLSRKLADTGITLIDAPVSGTKKPAEEGKLLILAGGDPEKITELKPLWKTMGQKVIYCGGVGQGSMMKMANNLLLSVMMGGLAEALNFGLRGGLSFESLLEVIFSGPLNCGLFQMKAGEIQQGTYPPSFPLKHTTKDLKFVLDTAYDTGSPVPLGQIMLHLYRAGVGQDWGDLDVAAIFKVFEYLNPPG
jgi:3-hydroxyisobutyrate dehydrogenase-like beta-hydroxyacid dehydrogenase